MKRTLAALLALSLAVSLHAQATYGPDQLDQLLAPIALYPDPLVALILPASTVPADITSAAQYLASNGDPAGIDSQPWDPSVRGLAHYPDVLKWMNDNIDWTRTLGAAFAMQPSDVMKSIQQLRVKARAAGTLTNTPQQQVDMEGDDIRIVPTQADTIYVPEYDPDVVYDVPEGDVGPYITFGVGFPVGAWLGFECNWDTFGIWVGPWQPGWGYRRDWSAGGRWHPNPSSGHALVRNYYRPGGTPPAPRVIAGARGPVLRQQSAAFHASPAPAVQSRPDFRGYGGTGYAGAEMARPSTPAPRGSLFGGYNRGAQARDFSSRGQASRQAPVRGAAPARSAAPERSAPAPDGNRDRH
jgi:uncharacterized protein DUF3300